MAFPNLWSHTNSSRHTFLDMACLCGLSDRNIRLTFSMVQICFGVFTSKIIYFTGTKFNRSEPLIINTYEQFRLDCTSFSAVNYKEIGYTFFPEDRMKKYVWSFKCIKGLKNLLQDSSCLTSFQLYFVI